MRGLTYPGLCQAAFPDHFPDHLRGEPLPDSCQSFTGGSCGKPAVLRFLRDLPSCYRVVPRRIAPLRRIGPLRQIDRPGQFALVPLVPWDVPHLGCSSLECDSRCCRSSPLAFNRALTREGGCWSLGGWVTGATTPHDDCKSRLPPAEGQVDVAATGRSVGRSVGNPWAGVRCRTTALCRYTVQVPSQECTGA
jgi:hypothetical protein